MRVKLLRGETRALLMAAPLTYTSPFSYFSSFPSGGVPGRDPPTPPYSSFPAGGVLCLNAAYGGRTTIIVCCSLEVNPPCGGRRAGGHTCLPY